MHHKGTIELNMACAVFNPPPTPTTDTHTRERERVCKISRTCVFFVGLSKNLYKFAKSSKLTFKIYPLCIYIQGITAKHVCSGLHRGNQGCAIHSGD